MPVVTGLRGAFGALSLGIGVLLAASPAFAHGGHEEAAPVINTPMAPRIVAQSNEFELVGVAHGKTLTLYLDRFSDNAPVTDAKIDLQVDGQNLSATPHEDGDYTITADWVAKPGRHDLVFTIMTATDSDLLAGSLEVPTASAAATLAGAAAPLAAAGPLARSNVIAFLLGLLAAFLAMGLRNPARLAAARGGQLAGAALVLVRARAAAGGSALRSWPQAARRRATSLAAATKAAFAGGPAQLARRAKAAAATALRARDGEASAESAFAEAPARSLRIPALRPIALRYVGERFAVSVVAVVCLVAIALFLITRTVFAHGGHDDGAGQPVVTGGNEPHRLLDGTLFVPKTSQRLLDLRTTITKTSEVSRTVRVVGQVMADPGTSGEIHATIRGRLEPASGVWPRVGQRVEAGEVLAWVVPVVNPIDRGIILQQVAQIDHEIGLVQDRLKHLTAEGSGASPRELDDARADLANLARRREAIAAVVKDRDNLRAPLIAPASGLIAASFAVAGQVVDEQDKLFDVVDPRRLWVQAYAYDVSALGKVLDADAIGSTGGSYRLKFVSRGPQLQKQTIPLYFQIENPDARLSVGSLVSVMVKTAGGRSGVVLPRTAVVRDASGQDVVWRHAYPESFVPMPVRVEPIDGTNVLVIAGLQPNTRVVVQAADLLAEVR